MHTAGVRAVGQTEPIVVELCGEIDLVTAPAIATQLALLPMCDTIVDVAGVTFFCAAGVTMLLRLSSRLHEHGSTLCLARPSSRVRWIIAVVEIGDMLPYRASVEEALDALTGQR